MDCAPSLASPLLDDLQSPLRNELTLATRDTQIAYSTLCSSPLIVSPSTTQAGQVRFRKREGDEEPLCYYGQFVLSSVIGALPSEEGSNH